MQPSIANNWMLHHNNAPCRKEISVIEFLVTKGISVVPQPHTPLIWVRATFFLKLKFYLNGRHFWTLENIKKAVTGQLKAIPVSDFQHCYKDWKRLQRCVASQGNYFEGGKLDL